MPDSRKTETMRLMEKQGYRFVGKNKHSCIKICEWCRESLRNKRVCYKEQFYGKEDGVQSHRCVQMTPVAFFCTHNCDFCWRIGDFTQVPENQKWDKPKEIIDQAIAEQRKILQGFKGSDRVNKEKFRQAMEPVQFAVSLTGEPTLYPYLPEMIREIKSRGASAYVVSNGTQPDMIARLMQNKETQPNKMYITLPAPNEQVYKQICHPMLKQSWKSIIKSLSLLKNFNSSVIRLTLVKDLNMTEPEQYAKIIADAQPTYVELKAFMSIGSARKRLPITSMPTHRQIRNFAAKIINAMPKKKTYKLMAENLDSRVVVLHGA